MARCTSPATAIAAGAATSAMSQPINCAIKGGGRTEDFPFGESRLARGTAGGRRRPLDAADQGGEAVAVAGRRGRGGWPDPGGRKSSLLFKSLSISVFVRRDLHRGRSWSPSL